ncbi:alpha/beta fold hydrolase [Goodfellowiella coeruleoviolacea]|uniref:Pimeloyl-ACP methyl ester carboxylesterase n=1 Tax=Goodfellowiella coeruleoviolacea TaxID=334858 RepID=A0AAE3GBD5_9PSEU|nr:alpha/beta fold hydrolase [Goodfellowiella coeruleoviolacea]MCP2163964.1 Pimeloyl-ACP methyl ester carboxylesterase [Goodfellowiella coeruleoviolacea]
MTNAISTTNTDTGLGPWEHQHTEVDGVRLHHVRAGTGGDPVVLLHGWPQTWYSWRRVIPRLAPHHQVLAVDLPGLGDSGFLPEGHNVRAAAALLDRWCAALGIDRVTVVGHDLGAPTAYAWAARNPERVRRLAVLDVPLQGFGLTEFAARAGLWHFGFFAVPGLAESLAAGRERVLLEHFYGHTRQPNAITPSDVDEYLRAYQQPRRLAAGFEYYRALPTDAVTFAEWARTPLAAPVLTLGGQHSGNLVPFHSFRQVATDVRNAVIPDSGHFLPEEQPELVAARLLEFLSEGMESMESTARTAVADIHG